MKKRYVLIRSNRLNSFGNDINSDNVTVINMFRSMGCVLTFAKECMLKMHWKMPSYIFNPSLKNIDADVFIVFDGHARKDFLAWLKKHNKDKRLIFWCWNTAEEIEKNFSFSDVPSGYEIWSYSEYDCQTRGFSYNTTFFWKDYKIGSDNNKPELDLYFVGKDKGRMKRILELKREFTRNGFRCLFQIMPNHKWNHSREYSSPIPYSKVLENIKRSKAILDIKVSETAGPSLRALEAAFYKKKLITDDMGVRKFAFYSPENIYILGGGIDAVGLKKFLNSTYSEIEPERLQYYNIPNWLLRFG